MKKPLMLLLMWILCQSNYAQNKTTNYFKDVQPITKTGISLPQLITTNINRSNLQFGLNLSEGLESPNLSVNFRKFISDDRKQLTITGGANLNQTLSFNDNDNLGFYTLNQISLHLGADLKLFNKKDYFVQFATHNILGKPGDFTDFDRIYTSNSVTFAVGKGRIDIVNDGAAALAVTEKLHEYGMMQRALSEQEYTMLVQKISELKNRRKYENRSYPLTETEEIQDLLVTFGIIDQDLDITNIIDDAYRFEPLLERTTGSQFKLAVSGSYFRSNSFGSYSNKGISAILSYHIHSAINSKWQYNKGISGYVVAFDAEFDDLINSGDNLRKVGIGIDNDLHYFIDNKIRLGFISNVGYNFVNRWNTFDPFGDPFFDNDGIFLNLRTELDYQITRTMSTSFGINLEITPENTFTGLSLGLKF